MDLDLDAKKAEAEVAVVEGQPAAVGKKKRRKEEKRLLKQEAVKKRKEDKKHAKAQRLRLLYSGSGNGGDAAGDAADDGAGSSEQQQQELGQSNPLESNRSESKQKGSGGKQGQSAVVKKPKVLQKKHLFQQTLQQPDPPIYFFLFGLNPPLPFLPPLCFSCFRSPPPCRRAARCPVLLLLSGLCQEALAQQNHPRRLRRRVHRLLQRILRPNPEIDLSSLLRLTFGVRRSERSRPAG